jgi:hypothetical protein
MLQRAGASRKVRFQEDVDIGGVADVGILGLVSTDITKT